MEENELYQNLLSIEERVPSLNQSELKPITDYADFVREAEWQQAWDPSRRSLGLRHGMRAGIWSDAIERCLSETSTVYIPKMDSPVYIDRPIVLRSGNRLIVHPETEIRLKVGSVGTCMVRNFQVASSQDTPIDLSLDNESVENGKTC